jgi:diguanylate cyclase (GGDEF)-like protein
MPSSSSSISPPFAPSSYRGRSYWQVIARVAPLAVAIHAAFALVLQWVGANTLALANVAVVALWGVFAWLMRTRRNRLAVSLAWLIIPSHAVFATVVVGWDAGFHYYLVLVPPLLFLSPGSRLANKVVLALVLTVFYITLDLFGRHNLPSHPLPPSLQAGVWVFNVTATFGMLAYFAHLYFAVVGEAEARLRVLATSDPLTGLANRRRMLELASGEEARGRRDGTAPCFILGDVDHFKRINDGSGHETGDQVLMILASALCSSLREVDTVARWGGEEFLMLLPDTSLEAALEVTDRVRERIASAVWPTPHPVTMTFGVSRLRPGESVAAAVARADEALYRGKLSGRNCCVPERPPVQPNSLPSSLARR